MVSANLTLLEEKHEQNQNRSVLKNLLVFCFAFSLQHAAVHALNNLQSTLNHENGLGVKALMLSSALGPVSGLLLPNLLLKYFNYKWIIVVGQLCYASFALANMFPSFYTLLPASVMVGLSGNSKLLETNDFLSK